MCLTFRTCDIWLETCRSWAYVAVYHIEHLFRSLASQFVQLVSAHLLALGCAADYR
jgi:hypothetical protein